jgi:methionyl-tRNA synthetase
MDQKAFYVTTPIYYVNDAPHIGHAYTTVAGDVLTRWHRQRGDRTWYLTGTDEHGTKVQQAAERNGVAPQEWVDRLVADAWQPMLATIEVANDDFIRTTQDRHHAGVQRFWQTLKDRGFVYEATFDGPYCVGCEEFKQPSDLVAGTGEFAGTEVCPIHGKPVEMLQEENWFFRLSAFTDRLLEHYERFPDFVSPASARNEVISFVKQGLRDISMSRSSVSWGIPLAWDAEQVTYVWFDALLNYVTAIGYGAVPGSRGAQQFAATWPADIHLVGKDILRFHAVFWPAMLMAADLPLPRQVFAHGWLLVGGEKMSKSKLTGISPDQITEEFGADAFRYYFMRAIAFGQDGSFSWEDMAARYTAELANGLGNLASRAQAMIARYFDGVLPQPGPYTNADLALQDRLGAVVQDADAGFTALRFSDGIAAVRSFVEAVNHYVTEQEPWVLAKDPDRRERLACDRRAVLLGHAAEHRANLGVDRCRWPRRD